MAGDGDEDAALTDPPLGDEVFGRCETCAGEWGVARWVRGGVSGGVRGGVGAPDAVTLSFLNFTVKTQPEGIFMEFMLIFALAAFASALFPLNSTNKNLEPSLLSFASRSTVQDPYVSAILLTSCADVSGVMPVTQRTVLLNTGSEAAKSDAR